MLSKATSLNKMKIYLKHLGRASGARHNLFGNFL
jgi:hypothetical protein